MTSLPPADAPGSAFAGVQPPSCSTASACRGESLGATASVVRAFVAVEVPRGWGPSTLRTQGLPPAVRAWLREAERTHGARPLLIRRPVTARAHDDGVHVLACNPRARWVESLLLPSLDAVASLDLGGLITDAGIGGERVPGPVVLVCTHGKHDPCCAVAGRPVAAALAAAGHDVWESSHLGGDRFAANAVLLPRGDYLGRLSPGDAARVVDAYAAGVLPPTYHRGRCTLPWPAQAAERALRERLDAWAFDAVSVKQVQREEALTRVTLVSSTPEGSRTHHAVVRQSQLAPQRLTCHAEAAEPAPLFDVAFEAAFDARPQP